MEYKRCRHPQCRTKLAAPTNNRNHAFHAAGCHEGFYSRRCLVCERILPAGARRQVCNWPGCRPAYRANPGDYKWPKTSNDGSGYRPRQVDAKSAQSAGLKNAIGGDRAAPIYIIAGPVITANTYHCATVPDGRDCQWSDGDYERTEAKNRVALKAVKPRAAPSPDRTPTAPMTIDEQTRLAGLLKAIPADLSIPAFLTRL